LELDCLGNIDRTTGPNLCANYISHETGGNKKLYLLSIRTGPNLCANS
jgi:hypothetical protein